MARNKKIKLLILDIEGVLTINKKKPIDMGMYSKLYAYCELARQGKKPPLVLCTGRPQPYAEAMIQCLDAFFPQYPSVVENGCFLYDPVKDILIANPAVAGKVEQIREIKGFLEMSIVKHGKAKIEPGKELCISLNPLHGSVERLHDEVLEAMPDDFKELVFITHSASAVDITPKGVNKGSGVEFLSSFVNVDLADMMAVGDTAGDFPMLSKVGIPACPANSRTEVIELVKKRGGYIAKEDHAAGVWEIILNYNLID